MLRWLGIIFGTVGAAIRCRHDLATENLALREQLAVMNYQCPRPGVTDADRFFWVALSRIWSGWRTSIHIVKPATIDRWHRQGFRLSFLNIHQQTQSLELRRRLGFRE